MIIDGRKIAEELYEELGPKFAARGAPTRLGILVVGVNPVIESFVRIKERAAKRLHVEIIRKNLPESASEPELIGAIEGLVHSTNAVIVQLPLPQHVDTDTILAVIPPGKDVDALNPKIAEEERPVHAPVALAVVELLRRGGVEIAGKRTVVVGAGRLVGAPSAWLLRHLGANVSVFSLEEGSIDDLKSADIIVSGVGKPGLIRPEDIKEGVVLIDAGTSELNKKIQGDADPACAGKTRIFTPVPGGVGPVAVALIFRNLFDLIGKGE